MTYLFADAVYLYKMQEIPQQKVKYQIISPKLKTKVVLLHQAAVMYHMVQQQNKLCL